MHLIWLRRTTVSEKKTLGSSCGTLEVHWTWISWNDPRNRNYIRQGWDIVRTTHCMSRQRPCPIPQGRGRCTSPARRLKYIVHVYGRNTIVLFVCSLFFRSTSTFFSFLAEASSWSSLMVAVGAAMEGSSELETMDTGRFGKINTNIYRVSTKFWL